MPLKKYSEAELEEIGNRLAPIAKSQRDTSLRYRQPKLDKIIKAEELYFNIVPRTLRGRFNIPMPIVSGFVDTLISKIDDEITFNFDHGHDADIIKCCKYNAAIKRDASPTVGKWRIKDILNKKLAAFSGVGLYCFYSESDPYYKANLYPVDRFDFHCEGTGGYDLEEHMFVGTDNIFRTKMQLTSSEYYNKKWVEELINYVTTDDYRKNQEIYQNRANRFKALGLDVESNSYTGVGLFNLSQWNMYDAETGRRFYLLFEPVAGKPIRCRPLEEITGEPDEGEQPKYMYKAWHTHPDAWNFDSKAPVDDVVPVAVAIKSMVNFMFDDVQKNLWGQRLYDPEMITDPSQLEWDRPDKLIQVLVPNGKRISDGIWQFPTGDKSSVTINMVDYFRTFIGVESGVTPQSKGESDEKILGIAKINEGEVADRLGLTNIFYTQCYAEIADAWRRGAKMCMPKDYMVKIIGEKGTESTYISSEDHDFQSDPTIRITGGKTEARKSQDEMEARNNALVQAIELFPNQINPKLAVEHLLENGRWKPDEIIPMLDVTIDGDQDEAVYASQAIEDILNGKKVQLYQGASTRFVQKIIDFAKRRQTDPKMAEKLMEYAISHMKPRLGPDGNPMPSIVVENKAREIMLAQKGNPDGSGTPPNSPNAPVAPTQPSGNPPAPAPNNPTPNAPVSSAAVVTAK